MDLIVNGERRSVALGTTVGQLLAELKVASERIVVEVNMKILKRAEHAGTLLHEGDVIELVRFVGGGS